MDNENTRGRVLRLAEEAVNGDRNADYGDPNQDFKRTAAFWNTYAAGVLERKLHEMHVALVPGTELQWLVEFVGESLFDTWDVGQMMTLLKTSRSVVSPQKEDHYVDGAGYQACAADCALR